MIPIILILFLVLFFLLPHQVTAPEAPQLPTKTSLLAVGDILLTRQVAAQIEKNGDSNLPFNNLQTLLKDADITFGNLECPLSENPNPIREGLIFRCPTKYLAGLINAGFDVLSTANNHMLDQGIEGLEFTINHLLSQNILPVGTVLSDSMELDTNDGPVIERDGVKIGFLGYSYTAKNDGGKSTHPQIASAYDLQKLQTDIATLKTRSDVVVVSMHAGTEYTRAPNQNQIDFAHAAIDAGANIVIGHHPHWIQPVEIYSPQPSSPGDGEGWGEVETKRQGIIFYSLGNFVFDQMWSQETREGLMVKLNFENQELKSAELLPVIIENYCCPRLANDQEKPNILRKINLDSDIIVF